MLATRPLYSIPIFMCVVLLLVSSTTLADDPQLIKVMVERPGIGDTSNLLHLKKLTGIFTFDSTVKKVTLVCEFYKKGEQLSDVPEVKATLQIPGGGTSGKFAIQVADIDYVQLGDAPKNHCRVLIELGLGETTLNAKEIDVPKYKFDLGQPLIGNFADWNDESGSRRPVFMFIGGKYRVYNPSPTTTIKENPEAEIVVGYLEFDG
jgi:hypothetical protein